MRPSNSPENVLPDVTSYKPAVAFSEMLKPYFGLKINYDSKKASSAYSPSSLMMDYIIHQINDLLVDNHLFRQACPDYHPYILRLYYGVLFWIQCTRAGLHASQIDYDAHEALNRFLDAFPPETLPISAPLVGLFKTLCCSQPEIPTYGVVYPVLPTYPGPARRRDFMVNDAVNFHLPNIPGIFALISDLKARINPDNAAHAVFPAKGRHIPVTASATATTIFGHHSFPILAERSDVEKWSLVSSGLQYQCEADKKLHENFAERFKNLDFPCLNASDGLGYLSSFLHMDKSMAWFTQVRDVASTEASFFKGSGTLADCSPFGIASNQVVVHYEKPTTLPTAPTCSADPLSLFPFQIRLKTTSRSLPKLTEAMASYAQTNIQMFNDHPAYPSFGKAQRTGPFWDIRPVETSIKDETSFYSYRQTIRGLMMNNRPNQYSADAIS